MRSAEVGHGRVVEQRPAGHGRVRGADRRGGDEGVAQGDPGREVADQTREEAVTAADREASRRGVGRDPPGAGSVPADRAGRTVGEDHDVDRGGSYGGAELGEVIAVLADELRRLRPVDLEDVGDGPGEQQREHRPVRVHRDVRAPVADARQQRHEPVQVGALRDAARQHHPVAVRHLPERAGDLVELSPVRHRRAFVELGQGACAPRRRR